MGDIYLQEVRDAIKELNADFNTANNLDAGLTYETVVISQVATAGTTVIKAADSTKTYRLLGLYGTLHAAGTLTIQTKPAGVAVALTGAMNLGANGGLALEFPRGGLPGVAGSNLQITTATGAFNGVAFISVEQE